MSGIEWIFFGLAIIGTGCAIWQTAVIKQSEKRKSEIQFLLASVHQLSLVKQIKWNVQIDYAVSQGVDEAIIVGYALARDEVIEMGALAQSLEGAVDSTNSASDKIMENTLKTVRTNNEIQAARSKEG